MTRREKVLAICVGGTLGGLALAWIVKAAAVDPFVTVHDRISKEQARQRRFRKNLDELAQVEKQWRELSERTLSFDKKNAQQNFREDMHKLLEQHNLRNPKVGTGVFVTRKDGSVEVPLTINATATLKDVVGFLCDFYRRPYLKRVDKVSLTAEMSVISSGETPRRKINKVGVRGAASPAKGAGAPPAAPPAAESAASGLTPALGPDGPELRITITAVTLVVPENREIKGETCTEIKPLDQGDVRYERPVYDEIADKNLFRPYQPTQAVVQAPPLESQPVEQKPPVEPKNPREGADRQFVVCTTVVDWQPLVYVQDERQPDQPADKYRPDQKIDDGTLLLIHPKGLVVRVKEGGKDKDYFYPLGESFLARTELRPEEQPEVYDALQWEFPSAGAEGAAAQAALKG